MTFSSAYFENGRDIGGLDTLLEIAAEQWLDTAEMRTLLEGTAVQNEVLGEVQCKLTKCHEN